MLSTMPNQDNVLKLRKYRSPSNTEDRAIYINTHKYEPTRSFALGETKVYRVDPRTLADTQPIDKPVPKYEPKEEAEPKGVHANLPACVYWISDGTAVKIGYTTDLNKRLAVLQTGNPRTLEVLKVVQFPTAKEAYQYEQLQHKVNAKVRIRGEWFTIV